MTKTREYKIPDDLEFIGAPRWTAERALKTLRLIEQAQEADLANHPDHPVARLVEAVLRRARAARQSLEGDGMTAEEAGAEIASIEARIREIRLRAGEPDRTRGVKVRQGYEVAGDMLRGKRKVPADDLAKMLSDRERGLTIGQIARKHHLTYEAAKKRLQRNRK